MLKIRTPFYVQYLKELGGPLKRGKSPFRPFQTFASELEFLTLEATTFMIHNCSLDETIVISSNGQMCMWSWKCPLWARIAYVPCNPEVSLHTCAQVLDSKSFAIVSMAIISGFDLLCFFQKEGPTDTTPEKYHI